MYLSFWGAVDHVGIQHEHRNHWRVWKGGIQTGKEMEHQSEVVSTDGAYKSGREYTSWSWMYTKKGLQVESRRLPHKQEKAQFNVQGQTMRKVLLRNEKIAIGLLQFSEKKEKKKIHKMTREISTQPNAWALSILWHTRTLMH